MFKKIVLGAFTCASIIGATTICAQAKVNMYQKKGATFKMITKNYTATYTLDETFALKKDNKVIGTWYQAGTGVGDTPFFLAIGKNEIVNKNVNLIVYSGTYGDTGECKLTRLDASANNGLTGTCTITPLQ